MKGLSITIVCEDLVVWKPAWQTSKLQNRGPLFDVELCLTVHKSFVSTSLNIFHRGSLIIRKYNELNHRDCAQFNINSDRNI